LSLNNKISLIIGVILIVLAVLAIVVAVANCMSGRSFPNRHSIRSLCRLKKKPELLTAEDEDHGNNSAPGGIRLQSIQIPLMDMSMSGGDNGDASDASEAQAAGPATRHVEG